MTADPNKRTRAGDRTAATGQTVSPEQAGIHAEDSAMNRFEADAVRKTSGRSAVAAVAVAAALLVALSGDSVRGAADELSPGIGRDIVATVGDATGWVADRVGLADDVDELTAGLSPDAELEGGGFDELATGSTSGDEDPGAATPRPLETLLVTGDSLSTPLDLELARGYAGSEVEVVRDPHLATAISNDDLVDWGALATSQTSRERPDAVVVFIGANEGYPMPSPGGRQVECCGEDWRAAFAARAERMMEVYSQGGAARVYWLSVVVPRDPDRVEIADAVNASIADAAEGHPTVEIFDVNSIFAPDGGYTDAIEIDGAATIVRESDGIHLNAAGSALAADLLREAIEADYGD